MKTHLPKVNLDQRKWHIIDADGVVLGRLAAKVADVLRGKNKAVYTPHLDAGDFVVCINAEKVKFTGRKLDQQHYHRFTGYVGNMKSVSARDMLDSKPEEVIKQAVKRMLPRNALGRDTFKKLKVYAGTEHPHSAQNPQPWPLPG